MYSNMPSIKSENINFGLKSIGAPVLSVDIYKIEKLITRNRQSEK